VKRTDRVTKENIEDTKILLLKYRVCAILNLFCVT